MLLFASVALGAGPIAKTLQVYYRDIKIKIDGNIKDPGQAQPFLYNGATYVPLRFVSEAMGKSVSWDDKQNLITITDGQYSVESLKQQIAQKDSELLYLRNQQINMASEISQLKKDLEEAKSSSKKKTSKDDIEDYLYDEYGSWNGMKFDFYVKDSRSSVTLTIELNRNKYKSKWDGLTKTKLEKWLQDIYDDVMDEYPKLKFSGTLEDTYDDETLLELGESRSKITVEYLKASGKNSSRSRYYLEDELNDEFGYGLTSYNKDFGKMTVDIIADVDDDYEEIDITLKVDTKNYGKEWDYVAETRGAENWIKDIVSYAQDEYTKYAVYGTIKNSGNKTMATFKATSSGKVTINWDYSY